MESLDSRDASRMGRIASLLERIMRPAVLRCTSRHDGRSIETAARHLLRAPADAADVAHLPSAQLRALLRITNGASFFADSEHIDDNWIRVGLRLLAVQELEAAWTELHDQLLEASSYPSTGAAKGTTGSAAAAAMTIEPHDVPRWRAGLLPIFDPFSHGDFVALDTFGVAPGREPRVLYLDSCVFTEKSIGPGDVEHAWPDLEAFLEHLAEGPMEILRTYWRFTIDKSRFFFEDLIYR